MPSVHSIPSIDRPSPVPQNTFEFPADRHLLITTPSRVLSWDSTGVHTLFKSSKSGIAAATESKDGSGVLAIADKHTVVLHDTKREKEKSWGLSAEQDEVRHLEYSKDSKSLFLSTTATNAIQCYSTQAQQLMSPPQTLSSPPAALAVSPTGHLMVSAQGKPPVVYLKDLAKNSSATLMKPQASTACVTIAAFHPERANIFLLAFDDGTLAVFDASRLSRVAGEGRFVNQNHLEKAEIGRIRQLHKAIPTKEGKVRAITGAAFIPGQKLRVVTVGMDGRCQLIDFSDSANVLRTWHCKAPLTSVSFLAPSPVSRKPSTAHKDNTSIQGGENGRLAAIGSYDGNVLLYDFLGLLQNYQEISETGERIIDVEWVAGPSPKAIPIIEPAAPDASTATVTKQSPGKQPSDRKQKGTTPKHLKAHPALRPPTAKPTMISPHARKFTIHPDEVTEDSTVRHTPTGKSTHKVSAEAEEYLDLFSPVNPFAAERVRPGRDSSHSPMRVRPRISSQTFITDSTPVMTSAVGRSPLSAPTLGASVESQDTSSQTVNSTITGRLGLQFRSNHAPSRSSPLKTERRKANPRSARKMEPFRRPSSEAIDASAAANARLLRDLRQMNTKSTNPHAGSLLQGYGSSVKKTGKQHVTGQESKSQQPASLYQQAIHTQTYGPTGRWPTDSADERSLSDDQQEDDIWITSDEERKRSSSRRHRLFQRPLARQTSRSRVDSNGTISITQSACPAPSEPKAPISNNANGGQSTEDYITAHSNISPDGAFSLASDDVQSLFPRTSSASPRRNAKGHHKQSGRSPRHHNTALQEIASNSASGRRPSDPWSRMKQAKSLPLPVDGSQADPATHLNDDCYPAPPHREGACGGCVAHASKVRTLEGEVAVMKGEILALRAMLRRHGIPTPPVSRR